MPLYSKNERNQVFGMLMVGATKQHVAYAFCCNVSTFTRLGQRVHVTERVMDRRKPRQPSVTTRRPDQHVRVNHLRNGFLTATKTSRQTKGVMGKCAHVLNIYAPLLRNNFTLRLDVHA